MFNQSFVHLVCWLLTVVAFWVLINTCGSIKGRTFVVGLPVGPYKPYIMAASTQQYELMLKQCLKSFRYMVTGPTYPTNPTCATNPTYPTNSTGLTNPTYPTNPTGPYIPYKPIPGPMHQPYKPIPCHMHKPYKPNRSYIPYRPYTPYKPYICSTSCTKEILPTFCQRPCKGWLAFSTLAIRLYQSCHGFTEHAT